MRFRVALTVVVIELLAAMTTIYTVEEAAQKLRKGRTWTWGVVRSGELRSFKIGARRVVSQDAIDEFIERAMASAAGSDTSPCDHDAA